MRIVRLKGAPDQNGGIPAGYEPPFSPGYTVTPIALTNLQQGGQFSVAVPALTEMLFGISLLPRAKQNLEEWERLKSSFGYYDIDQQRAEQAARLQVALRRQGRQLETVDALLATVALQNDLILLTTNGDFAPITGLKQENWLTL